MVDDRYYSYPLIKYTFYKWIEVSGREERIGKKR